MNARAYYNDTSKAACAVMRQLIADGVIPAGDVDDRSIEDVLPDDLRDYTQCHFFAGGGLWPVAARLAGWPDERRIWTGSCPCQPYSVAGKGLGADDPRHLWPHFLRLIRAARPPVVMGEQVAGKAGYGWFDGVRADLAGEDYASRSVDIPALAVDAPHERNRMFWVAVGDADAARKFQREGHVSDLGRRALHADACSLDDAFCNRQRKSIGEVRAGGNAAHDADGRLLADRDGAGSPPHGRDAGEVGCFPEAERGAEHDAPVSRRVDDPAFGHMAGPGRNGSFWSDAEWIICHDGKARRTKPGLPLLVDGFPGRVDLWSIAGNAISPVLAAEVIAAFLDMEASQ